MRGVSGPVACEELGVRRTFQVRRMTDFEAEQSRWAFIEAAKQKKADPNIGCASLKYPRNISTKPAAKRKVLLRGVSEPVAYEILRARRTKGTSSEQISSTTTQVGFYRAAEVGRLLLTTEATLHSINKLIFLYQYLYYKKDNTYQ